jgi:hypothetical protein
MLFLERPARTYWQHLWRVEAAVAASLALYGVVLALLILVGAAVFAPAIPGIDGAGAPIGLVMWFGAIPLLVLFAPTYAMLRWVGFANLPLAIALGFLCALVFARSGPLALFALPCCVMVAAAAHLILKRVR